MSDIIEHYFLDTETTSNKKNEMIQVGILTNTGYSVSANIRPTEDIMPCATTVHGVTTVEARAFPEREPTAKWLDEVLNVHLKDAYFLAHNAEFDLGIVRALLKEVGVETFQPKSLDVLRLARKVVPMDQVGNHKLDTLHYWLFPERLKWLKDSRASHDALTDCVILKEVFEGLAPLAAGQMLRVHPVSMADLAAWVLEPFLLKEWPFGKHKGDPIEAHPDYAEWVLKQKEFETSQPDLVFTLKQLHRGRSNRFKKP